MNKKTSKQPTTEERPLKFWEYLNPVTMLPPVRYQHEQSKSIYDMRTVAIDNDIYVPPINYKPYDI